MTEYFRITGLNNINFDQAIPGPYRLTGGSPPIGMSKPLTRQEVLSVLPRLPLGIRSHVLSRGDEKQGGLSIITCQFNIQGATDAQMEQYRHDLTETLEDAALYIETQGARGTQTVLRYKMDNVAAGNDSYKTIFFGTVDEMGGRDVLGGKVKDSFLEDMKLTLYCEPYWRPNSTTNLVNAQTIHNHDDAGHNNYVDIAGANINGDVAARIRLRAEATGVSNWTGWVVAVARRTRGTPTTFAHIREAESFPTLNNWAVVPDVACSNGNKLSNNAHAGGSAIWILDPPGANNRGRFHVVGCLKTDDIVNTRVQFSYQWLSTGAGPSTVSGWKYMSQAGQWNWVDFGSMFMDPFLRSGITIDKLLIRVTYEKDAADLAEFDFLMFLPEDEYIAEFEPQGYYMALTSELVSDDTGDFDYVAMEDTGEYLVAQTKRGEITLQPRTANRLIFGFYSFDKLIPRRWNQGDSWDITIDYLPQYISPLE